MNIGLFTDTYFPQINGVATSTKILEQELAKLGHKVYIFTTTDPKAKEALPRVYRLPSMPFTFLPSHRVALVYPPRLLVNLKKFNLDIIHTQSEFPVGIFGRIVAGFYKIPSVHTYHTMYEDYVHYVANGHLITPKMAQKYSRLFCNRASAVIAPVEKAKDSLISYGVTKPITVIPTGIVFEPFARGKYSQEELDETKLSVGLNLSDPVIIYIGRIAQEKSLDVIINKMPETLKLVPDAKLVIVGNGPKREDLEELSKSLGIEKSVIFTGPRPWAEIGKYYQLGDVFVSASTSETQGLTYIEAMAAQVLVVAKKDRSIEGVVIDGETGYYFENDSELPAILQKALTEVDTRKEIVSKALENIAHLSSEAFAKNVEALYNETLAKREKRPRTRRTLLRR